MHDHELFFQANSDTLKVPASDTLLSLTFPMLEYLDFHVDLKPTSLAQRMCLAYIENFISIWVNSDANIEVTLGSSTFVLTEYKVLPYIWNFASAYLESSQLDLYLNGHPIKSFTVSEADIESARGATGEWMYIGGSATGDKVQGYMRVVYLDSSFDGMPYMLYDYFLVPDCFTDDSIMDFGYDFIDIDLRWYDTPPTFISSAEGQMTCFYEGATTDGICEDTKLIPDFGTQTGNPLRASVSFSYTFYISMWIKAKATTAADQVLVLAEDGSLAV